MLTQHVKKMAVIALLFSPFFLIGVALRYHSFGIIRGNSDQFIIIDGDTLKIGERTISLWGIDAPEINQTCTDAKENQMPCGEQAKLALMSIIRTGPISCKEVYEDQFGSTFSRCRAEALDMEVNALMVQSGYALDYQKYSKGMYNSFEDRAAQQKSGIWKYRFVKPLHWRRGMR